MTDASLLRAANRMGLEELLSKILSKGEWTSARGSSEYISFLLMPELQSYLRTCRFSPSWVATPFCNTLIHTILVPSQNPEVWGYLPLGNHPSFMVDNGLSKPPSSSSSSPNLFPLTHRHIFAMDVDWCLSCAYYILHVVHNPMQSPLLASFYYLHLRKPNLLKP